MTLEEMKKRRLEKGLTYEQLAARSGIPVATVQKIFGGVTKNPRYSTLAALERVLAEPAREMPSYLKRRTTDSERKNNVIKESSAGYGASPSDRDGTKGQGEYTIYDLEQYSGQQHLELIDGVLYDMGEPTTIHQMIVVQLCALLLACITEHNLDCVPFVAPTKVQLDRDIYTMVEPDVFVICDRSRILKPYVSGAPDFCAEVLSPASRSRDMNLKCEKYRKAGVREYWIIDPDQQKIIVCLFGENPDINIYGFQDRIPVEISKGLCEIDFSKILDYIKFLM